MLEHFFNCHGEWNALLALVSSTPFVSYWIHSKYYEHKEDKDEIG